MTFRPDGKLPERHAHQFSLSHIVTTEATGRLVSRSHHPHPLQAWANFKGVEVEGVKRLTVVFGDSESTTTTTTSSGAKEPVDTGKTK